MKILHLSKFFRPDPGGIERIVGQLADGAAAAGHQVRVVAATGSSWVRDPSRRRTEPPRDDVVVVRLATYGVLWSQPIAPGYLAAARWPADVVHLHHPHPLADLAARLAPRRPLVVTHHSDVRRQWFVKPLYRPLVRSVLRRADAIVVPTRAHIGASPELRGLEAKIRIIPFGVDLERFTPRSHPEPPPGFPTGVTGPIGLFVGRLVSYKGLDVLIEALRGTSLHVAILGGGPVRAALEAHVLAAGVQRQVTFAGEPDDKTLVAWYQAADYVVLPSTTMAEMFGVVLLEAMAMARPVLTTALPTGVREVNRAGETGLEVPPGDARALREAMQRLVDDAALREQLGEAGRKRVQQHYTLEAMMAGHLALYAELVGHA